jgi:hypothetical protein
MVDTRIVSGIIEKHYQIAARQFRIKKDLLSPGLSDSETGLDLALSTLLDGTKAEIVEGVRAGVIDLTNADRTMGIEIAQATFQIPPARAEAFRQRLQDLITQLGDGDDEPEGEPTQVYRLLYAWYPTARRLPDEDEE